MGVRGDPTKDSRGTVEGNSEKLPGKIQNNKR